MGSTRSREGREARGRLLLAATSLAAAVLLGMYWHAVGSYAPGSGRVVREAPDVPGDGDQAAPVQGAAGPGEGYAQALDPAGDEATSAYAVAQDVPEAAAALVERYRSEGTCLLRHAEYLDLLGGVWSCLVEGPGWVDMCVVRRLGADESLVRVRRMEVAPCEGGGPAGGVGGS